MTMEKIYGAAERKDGIRQTGRRRWWSLHGFVAGDTLGAELEVRSSLRIVETVRYKRFLGFLWKTHKVQSRKVHVLSLNPNERIDSVEFIVVEE